MEFRFGVDLITFYHPSFWGADDRQSFEKVALGDPHRFWDRIAESVLAAGITGVEVTFPPATGRRRCRPSDRRAPSRTT